MIRERLRESENVFFQGEAEGLREYEMIRVFQNMNIYSLQNDVVLG